MACAAPTASSTKETTNYARLCRLLVDIGTQALRDVFDAIHAPANLHAVLAAKKATLQSLSKRKVINLIQWGKLFPLSPTSVSSRDFDTTLLMVLLRNLCGLTPPLTGWDALPAVTDLSREADIARVKYYRNTVYGHAENASVDDVKFNDYWRDIRDTLVRLGGVWYQAAIDDLRNECMDPEVEDHYMELLSQWKKDEDNIKEELGEIKKMLNVLTASIEVTDEDQLKELMKKVDDPVTSKEVIDQGAVMAGHEIKLKVVTQNLDAEKQEKFKEHFASDIFMFMNYNTFSPTEEIGVFLKWMEDAYNLRVKALGFGCLEIRVQCATLGGLDRLWRDYCSGHLNEMAERCLLTDEIRMKLELKAVRLKTVIKEEDYVTCRKSFLETVAASKGVTNPGANVKLHDLKIKIATQNQVDAEKQEKSNQQFAADISIFIKQHTFSPSEGLDVFLQRIADAYNLRTKALGFDCLKIRVECVTLGSIERLWRDYCSGRLSEIAERCLLTDEVTKKLKLKAARLKTVIKADDYLACRKSFLEPLKPSRGDTNPGALVKLELHEVMLKIATQTTDAEKQEKSNEHFATDILMFMNYSTFSPTEGLGVFLKCIEDAYNLSIKALGFDCLEIPVQCPTLGSLEILWKDYRSGHLNQMAERCLLTDEVRTKPQLRAIRLKIALEDEEYEACRTSFLERGKPSRAVTSPGAVMELHEITVKVTPSNINADKEEKINQHFKAAVSMFMNSDKSSSHRELGDLLECIEDTHNVHITAVGFSSLEIRLECPTLDSLESLKSDYCSGRLNDMAERCLLTDEVREKLDLKDVTLKTVIKQEDYLACRKSFLESSENMFSYNTDHSKSQAEGKGLKEVEQGVETNFTVTTRDSEGKQFYSEQEQVTVTIRSPTGEEEVQITDCKDGNYTIHYKLKSVGRHDVAIEINGWPLTGSPWRVDVKPHQYKMVKSFGSRGRRRGEFNGPCSIAKNEKTGDIAVADFGNRRVQVFDENLRHLRTIGGGTGSQTGAAVKIGPPISLAFLRNGDMIVIHGDEDSTKMSVITDDGQFSEQLSEHLIEPWRVFVDDDVGHVIVYDPGDLKIKVLSPDGAELLQSFRVPHCDFRPICAFHHRDMFFVWYPVVHCVKVFSKEGVFLHDIGSEGSGIGELKNPRCLVIDTFDNLIVWDRYNERLQMFTLDGAFLASFGQEIQYPMAVTVCKNGDLLVTDRAKHSVLVFR